MPRDTTVAFRQPEAIDDPLSEVAREGARRMLAQVLISEADSFVALWRDLKLPDVVADVPSGAREEQSRVVRRWPPECAHSGGGRELKCAPRPKPSSARC